MKLFSLIEGWSIKIFLKKILSRSIPIAATWATLKITSFSPEAFAGVPQEQSKLVFSAVLWAAASLVQNVIKFKLDEPKGE